MQPLGGIKVLDLTRYFPGAIATMALLHAGAEVIKIEQPGCGDPARNLPGGDWLFSETNAGKKSIAIDLKTSQGREAMFALVTKADVLIESFRPGVMAGFKLDYLHLCTRNPRLIYGAITGYGQSTPNAASAGHDINYVAMAGLLGVLSNPGGAPRVPKIQIADLVGGSCQALVRVLLALLEREKTGCGQFLDISMTAGLQFLLTIPLAAMRANSVGHRIEELLSGAFACYNVYATSDRGWLAVGALEPRFWKTLCQELDYTSGMNDQFAREPRQGQIKMEIAAIFESRTSAEWTTLFANKEACVTPVRSLPEAIADGFGNSLDLFLGRAQGRNQRPPRLGEHSISILESAGVRRSKFEEWKRAGAVC